MSFYIAQARRGFTILEVVVALGIFALLALAITDIILISFRTRDVVFEQLSVQNEARKAAQDFVNEVRSAAASSIGAYPLETVATSTLTFYANIDSDSYRERVRYFLSGTTLKKGVVKPTGNPLTYNPVNEIITDVVHSVVQSSTLFTYYNQSYNGAGNSTPLAEPVGISDVRVVGMTLALEKNPNTSPVPFAIQAKAEVRNLKSN